MHPKPLFRRTHSPDFKARVLAASPEPPLPPLHWRMESTPILCSKWLAGNGVKRAGLPLPAAVRSTRSLVTPIQFLPVDLGVSGHERGVSSGTQNIHLDLDLGTLQIKMNCPRDSAPSAAALLHALADMAARA